MRVIAENRYAVLLTCRPNLHSAGAELERQCQLIVQHAEAKVQQMMHGASLHYQAAEKRALDAENNLRQFQSTAVNAESDYRNRWEQLQKSAGHCGERSPPPRRRVS